MHQHHNPAGNQQIREPARAPYNFVPLPDAMLDVRHQFDESAGPVPLEAALPDHDRYYPDRRSGYFDVTLTTESPLFVRGMTTFKDAEELASSTISDNRRRELKNKPDFFHLVDPLQPVIPGTSLRGMLRNLLEIITFGKLQPVTDRQLIYRAVGDTTSLGNTYKAQTLGANPGDMRLNYPQSTLRGGYLKRTATGWAIRPAQQINHETFALVPVQVAVAVLGPLDYHTIHPVWVEPTVTRAWYATQGGRQLHLAETQGIASRVSPQPAHSVSGTLVVPGQPPQHHHWYPVIYPESNNPLIDIPNTNANPLWALYEADRELPRGNNTQTRRLDHDGQPLFYLVDNTGQLVFFGPTMLFRLPYPNTIDDFIPDREQYADYYDFAEAMFGFVRREGGEQGEKQRAYAGRISVTDATIIRDQPNAVSPLEPHAITPPILSTPKPTTFQHYLEQPNGVNTLMEHLLHYGNQNTGNRVRKVRGHKLYWRQRLTGTESIAVPEQTRRQHPRQYTSLHAVSANVQFKFRVYFENLTDIELGALTWTLMLQGGGRHMLGMGKPFGMGVVRLEPDLVLIDRGRRYKTLFDENGWYEGKQEDGPSKESFRKGFTDFISQIYRGKPGEFERIDRIKELLVLLKPRDPQPELEYMLDLAEFRQRPVLPRPSQIPAPPQIQTQQPEIKAAELTVGSVVRGIVDYVDDTGIFFYLDQDPEGEMFEPYIPRKWIVKKRGVGTIVKAVVEAIRPNPPSATELTCRQIVD